MSQDNVFLDLQISTIGTQTGLTPLSYSQVLQNPYLFNPNKYKMAIARFTMDTLTVPKYIVRLPEDSTSATTTAYGVQLAYGTTKSDIIYIEWSPSNKILTPPKPPSENGGYQNLQTAFYYGFTYEYFTNLVNDAYILAMANLRTKIPSLDPLILPPTIYWSQTGEELAYINAQSAYYDNSSSSPCMYVYMNSPLYVLYNTFNADYEGDLLFRLNLSKIPTGINCQTFDGEEYIVLRQEGDSLFQWNPFSAVMLVSNTINVLSSTYITPTIYNNGKVVVSPLTVKDQLSYNIITDFVSAKSYNNALIYEPQIYRWLNMKGSTEPQNSIDLQVYFRDKLTGQLIPYTMGNDSVLTVKFLFQKI